MKRLLFFGAFCLSFLASHGQTKTSYSAETGGFIASGEHTPFWTVNHNWGIVSLDAGNFYLRGGIFHEQTIRKDLSFEAGLDLVGASSSNYGNTWIQQLYGRLNWKIWRLDIGSREDYVSLLHPYLSSGDFINSNNARPIPQIKISLPDFILVPHTKGNIFIKGDFSIGKYMDSQWLEEQALPHKKNYTKDIFLHNKAIYFKFGDIETQHKQQFTVGMMHATQWAGSLYQVNFEGEYEVVHQPHGITDLARVAIAKEGSSSASGADKAYVSGSQWGAYTFRYDYKLKENKLSFYLHHIFDDGSGMVFENYRDNLIGVEFQTKEKSWLSGCVFEYVYTKQQTGPIHHNIGMDDDHRDQLMKKGNGNDNYYNNVDYVQGPSYFGKTLGTPLLLSPEYNTDGNLNFKSSRIVAFHLGVEGYISPEFQYRLLLTKGESWGRYYQPFIGIKKGIASQLELIYHAPQVKFPDVKLSIGYDDGQFFGGNTFGGCITLTQRNIIHAK
jgi:hypothetical protein